MSNPFFSSASDLLPGTGKIRVALVGCRESLLREASYQYPLKLVTTTPLRLNDELGSVLIHTVYLLTYGGGLLAGDQIDLKVTLDSSTRLVLLTQGNTKLFKSYDGAPISQQRVVFDLHPGSSLCYLPDPVQPFAHSSFQQRQTYNICTRSLFKNDDASFCVLDWVSNGRPANGENWSLRTYKTFNEVFIETCDGNRKLLVRDNVILDHNHHSRSVADRMALLSASGTLMLYGPMFAKLAKFVMEEFKSLPRVGNRKFEDPTEETSHDLAYLERRNRHRIEEHGALMWSVAVTRGVTVLKFGSRQLEDGRRWLASLLRQDGTVQAKFGSRALLCLQ